MVISSASRSSCGVDIHNNTIPSIPYVELGFRYASNGGDALEIFGKVNNLFESGPYCGTQVDARRHRVIQRRRLPRARPEHGRGRASVVSLS
jgi:hypothetical protein